MNDDNDSDNDSNRERSRRLMAHFAEMGAEAAPLTQCRSSDPADGFLIVGAGLSGLAAAHYLQAHTVGCRITVLEAADIAGGRVRTIKEPGPFQHCEAGAGWIHEHVRNPMSILARALGVPTLHVGGDSSYIGGDRLGIFDNGHLMSGEQKNASFALIDTLVELLERRVALERARPDGPRDVPLATAIAEAVVDLNLTAVQLRHLRYHLDVIFGGDWATPLEQLSTMALELGPLAYEGGDRVFPAGFAEIPERLASGLDVRYGKAVSEIHWGSDGDDPFAERRHAVTADGDVFAAQKILVTTSIG